ncbi:hypothetical protein SCFA_640004 [anaerobic digester metagenome]|uniref:Uncharacterized protein n=1 Tax=anaerobic digester metagenome TaxID=1263854 RepID=A0A485M4L3_9ZZZZ
MTLTILSCFRTVMRRRREVFKIPAHASGPGTAGAAGKARQARIRRLPPGDRAGITGFGCILLRGTGRGLNKGEPDYETVTITYESVARRGEIQSVTKQNN